MNVLAFSQYFWPENFRINDLVQSLKQHVSVAVLTGQPNYPQGIMFPGYGAWGCRTEQWSGVDVHRVPLAPRGCGSAIGLVKNYLSFIVSAAVLAPFKLRGKPVDIVFVYATSPLLQAIPAVLLCWIECIKLIITKDITLIPLFSLKKLIQIESLLLFLKQKNRFITKYISGFHVNLLDVHLVEMDK